MTITLDNRELGALISALSNNCYEADGRYSKKTGISQEVRCNVIMDATAGINTLVFREDDQSTHDVKTHETRYPLLHKPQG